MHFDLSVQILEGYLSSKLLHSIKTLQINSVKLLKQQCCSLTWQVAEHHTQSEQSFAHSFPMGWEKKIEKKHQNKAELVGKEKNIY